MRLDTVSDHILILPFIYDFMQTSSLNLVKSKIRNKRKYLHQPDINTSKRCQIAQQHSQNVKLVTGHRWTNRGSGAFSVIGDWSSQILV